MKKKIFIISIAFLSLLITSCAILEEQWANQTEQELIAAGFITKLANSPEKLEKLDAMKQRTIVLHDRNGTNFYIYADNNKNCIYIGNNKSYQKYQNIKIQKELAAQAAQTAADNRTAASYNQMTAEQNAMDWEMWGPWGPYGW